MKAHRFVTHATLAVASIFALVGCAPAPIAASAPPAVEREAAALVDCGGWGSGDAYPVQVLNLSSKRILLSNTQIDCYDWYGNQNPTRFNVDLASGTTSAVEILHVTPIPQSSSQIRPWDFDVSVDDPAEGFVITGRPASRPTIKADPQSCYTSNGGITACLGMTLCADDPARSTVVTQVALHNMITGEKSSLKMRISCATGSPSMITFSD
jgi:hypothetical protein